MILRMRSHQIQQYSGFQMTYQCNYSNQLTTGANGGENQSEFTNQTHPGQSFSLTLCGPNSNTRLDPNTRPDGIIGYEKLTVVLGPHSNLSNHYCQYCQYTTEGPQLTIIF